MGKAPGKIVQPQKTLSWQERWISLGILLILAGIGFAVFMAQFRSHPALEPLQGAGQTAGTPADSAAQGPKRFPRALFSLPEGIGAITPPEFFDASRLSDKINGKAELYLDAGFKALECQRFAPTDKQDAWFELFAYEMDSAEAAFSVFSSQRREGAASPTLGDQAYRTQNALFLTHGPYYLELISSQSLSEASQPLKAVAKAFIQANPVQQPAKAKRPDIRRIFPDIPGFRLDRAAITLLAANVFGFEQLDRVYLAPYRSAGGEQVSAFISRRESRKAAEALLGSYADFLLAFGGTAVPADSDIPGARIIDILGYTELVFSRGRFLAGVHEAEAPDMARKLATALNQKLKEFVPDGP